MTLHWKKKDQQLINQITSKEKIGIKNKNRLSGNKISQIATKVSFENG